MRILIAEDETELAKGLKFLLEKNMFTVDIVHDGAEALSYFRCRDYDVVILDIMMPKIDGLEVLRQIREAGSGVPVLMLTAKAEIEDRVIGLEAERRLPSKTFCQSGVYCQSEGSFAEEYRIYGGLSLFWQCEA